MTKNLDKQTIVDKFDSQRVLPWQSATINIR